MNTHIAKFIKLSDLKHEYALKNDSKNYNKVFKKIFSLNKFLLTDDMIKVVRENKLSDWQMLDFASKLLIDRKVLEMKSVIFELTKSKDLNTRIDSSNYLEIIIPELEKNKSNTRE